MIRKPKIRSILLVFLLLVIWTAQLVPIVGAWYAYSVYPVVSYALSSFSRLIPFAIGDLFIFLSLLGVILYPIYGRIKKHPWKTILLRDGEYLLWVYAWFYLAWGLNYSQPNFFMRNQISYSAFTPENLKTFTEEYIVALNESYIPVTTIDEAVVRRETVSGYHAICDSMGVHRPQYDQPRAKTMLFTPLSSKVSVIGSMGPFFCEFTLNGDLLPSQYPSTYAHEYAHFLGISSEAEANFYAYQICTRSHVPEIRFCGYFSIMGHLLSNARRLMTEEEYTQLFDSIRPEIIQLARQNQEYWMAKYSPLMGDVQDLIYDLYLKFNKIESGRKNYSEVVGLLISYNEWKRNIQNKPK